jgi:hypothetical protein
MPSRPAMTHDRSKIRDFLVVGEVPGGFAVFVVLGDEAEGFEGFESCLNCGFAAAGVFELGGDRYIYKERDSD